MLSTREGLRVYIKIQRSGSSLCDVTVLDEFGLLFICSMVVSPIFLQSL